jgi:SOS response regulatory protein OraA/RecX
MIKIELRRKGISPEDIENAFKEEDGAELSQETAGRQLILKKVAKYKNLPHLEAKKKLIDMLLRRGFSMSLAVRLVDEVIQKDYNR